jgi:hypothetical protein
MHETFLIEFPYLLYEWLKRQTATIPALRPLESIVWDQVTVDRMKEMISKWTQAIDSWFARVKECYIIEFDVGYTDSFSEVERKLIEGPRRRILEEIPV